MIIIIIIIEPMLGSLESVRTGLTVGFTIQQTQSLRRQFSTLTLLMLLPPPLKSWDCRHVPHFLAFWAFYYNSLEEGQQFQSKYFPHKGLFPKQQILPPSFPMPSGREAALSWHLELSAGLPFPDNVNVLLQQVIADVLIGLKVAHGHLGPLAQDRGHMVLPNTQCLLQNRRKQYHEWVSQVSTFERQVHMAKKGIKCHELLYDCRLDSLN